MFGKEKEKMMGYQLFKDVIEARIPEMLPPMYGECSIAVRKMWKVNEEKECLSVMPKGEDGVIATCPNIYLDEFYDEFKECQDMDHILRKIASYIIQFTCRIPYGETGFDLKNRKEAVVMNIINRERNEELLKNVPHKEFLDLAVIYRIVMTQEEDGLNTILITYDVMKEMETTEEELDQLAMENTMRMFPATITSFSEHIYMMTSTIKINGATTMVYQEAIKNFSRKIGKNLFVVPSSIHEVMLIPEKSADLEFIKATLEEGNRLYVTQKEFLSGNVYFYNRNKDTIRLAG